MEFRPIGDRIVIHPEVEKTVSDGGILLPGAVGVHNNKGFVVSVGCAVRELKEGDYVYYDAARCGVMEIGGDVYHIAREEDGQVSMVMNRPDVEQGGEKLVAGGGE